MFVATWISRARRCGGFRLFCRGHTARLGWALTPNAPDFADVSPEQYPYPKPSGAPGSLTANAAAIQQRQAMLLQYLSQTQPYYVRTPNGLEERLAPVWSTTLGPILEDAHGALYSWKIGGYGDFGGFRQLIDMARAPDLQAFQAALQYHQFPVSM